VGPRYSNPILPGCHPDPSICRAGEDFYLVNSTFEYFPGLPVHHSRDLVHWRPLGHVLDRPSQLQLDGVRPSGGLYAPTIRHWRGTFYVVCTLVDGRRHSGSFVVTATDPAGPWSEPVWLEGPGSFDPSLLFTSDGRVWYHACRQVPRAPRGRTEVWTQELDLGRMALTGRRHVLWTGAMAGAMWAEGPHLYEIDGRYHLLAAEGGTDRDHAVAVARAERVTGPYTGSPRNPVLTHRHLGRDHPVMAVGHADLVDTPAGDWWAVLLATRPYGGYFTNLGRETFLVPVTWEDGWPVFCPGVGRIELELPGPDLAPHPWPATPARDDFDAPALAPEWNVLRTPREEWWSLSARPGHLRLRLRPATVAEHAQPSFVGRRQQHLSFAARAAVEFDPAGPDECAGLVALLSGDQHIRFVVTLGTAGGRVVRAVRRDRAVDEVVAEAPVADGRVRLAVEARGQEYALRHAGEAGEWGTLAVVDGRLLSPTLTGGFVGTYVGMYASSGGRPSDNHADFDWFEYEELR
jgi:alpha-N-arabinofuranosidase